MITYSYILAPHTANNFAILQEAVNRYADLQQEARIKTVYAKNIGDVVGADGQLLSPANSTIYIYMKATTGELDYELLSGVTDYTVYTIDTQPFAEYWL